MKVLQIIPELNSGGVEVCTLQVAQHLVKKGHKSLVISNGGKQVATLEAVGSRHITMPVHRKNPLTLLQVRKLRALIRREKPDIIHSRSRVPDWIAYLVWRKLPPQDRPRFITSVHGLHSVNRYSKIVASGEAVICVSQTAHDYVTRSYPDIPREKLHVIYDGIDLEKWRSDFKPSAGWLKKWQQEFPTAIGKKVLVLPGRLTRLKGHADFLHALAQLPSDTVGVLAGHCAPEHYPYRESLMNLAAELGISDRVLYVGARGDLQEIYSISSIVYSLSQKPESFGLTTVEALASGRPVIGYDHGGVSETMGKIFPEGLVPVGDIDAVVRTSRGILTSNARPSNEIPFSLENTLSQTLALYESLIE